MQDIQRLLFVIATFDIRNTNEMAVFTQFKRIFSEEQSPTQTTTISPSNLNDLVEAHFNLAKIAAKRKDMDERNAMKVLMDMLNSKFFDLSSVMTFGNAAKICAALQLAEMKTNQTFLVALAEPLTRGLP